MKIVLQLYSVFPKPRCQRTSCIAQKTSKNKNNNFVNQEKIKIKLTIKT